MSGVDPAFWSGRRVLLTGHTGFKGSWAALWLARMGASVTGVALAPSTDPALFALAGVAASVRSHIADVRDLAALEAIATEADPEIVLHLAAQPLVRRSVADPVETFAVNVMGTVNVLQAARRCPRLKAVLIVTTDKVYENDESGRAFREEDALGGRDPYAASKAAAELATRAMARTYFADAPVATARGGNVIGGGDFSEDRLIPDIVRSIEAGRPLRLRNPAATRPWQHVLDCLAGYFCFAQSLAEGKTHRRALNFGPAAGQEVSVRDLADAMFDALGAPRSWVADEAPAAHEANSLAIDSTAARAVLGWRDRLPRGSALDATAEWYRAWSAGANMRDVTLGQIRGYEEMGN